MLLLRVLYSFELPRGAKIGKNVEFVHRGLGTVISSLCEIGDNCRIQHHVTIGVRNKECKAPKIGKNVEIGCYATILGDVTIGDNAVIGANTLVLHDVEPNTTYIGDSTMKRIR